MISRAINSVNLNLHPNPTQFLPVIVKVHYAMHNISPFKFFAANPAPTL